MVYASFAIRDGNDSKTISLLFQPQNVIAYMMFDRVG